MTLKLDKGFPAFKPVARPIEEILNEALRKNFQLVGCAMGSMTIKVPIISAKEAEAGYTFFSAMSQKYNIPPELVVLMGEYGHLLTVHYDTKTKVLPNLSTVEVQ